MEGLLAEGPGMWPWVQYHGLMAFCLGRSLINQGLLLEGIVWVF